MWKNKNTQNLHSFLAIAFWRAFVLSRLQQIWNQHRILRFFIPILLFITEKNFCVIRALFANFKCICEKNYTFSNILQKGKKLFSLPISIILLWFLLSLKHWSPPKIWGLFLLQFCFIPSHPQVLVISDMAVGRVLFNVLSYIKQWKYPPPLIKKGSQWVIHPAQFGTKI